MTGGNSAPHERTGYVPVEGFRLFYRAWEPALPGPVVLGLHGGPGASHDYLEPFSDLAGWGYRVVLFDQLGCGRSELPPEDSRFTLEHHLLEVDAVRGALDLGRVHLVGSSYGGLLALAAALRFPQHLRSLTTVGGLADVPYTVREMERLREALDPATAEVLRRPPPAHEGTDSEYDRALDRFYRTHLCRLDPWPAPFARSMAYTAERPVYRVMNGPNEFSITGRIREVNLVPELARIGLPTLVLGGRYDEVTPNVAEQIRREIPGARRVEFEHSSHVPFWEERAHFTDVLGGFLREVDADPAGSRGERA